MSVLFFIQFPKSDWFNRTGRIAKALIDHDRYSNWWEGGRDKRYEAKLLLDRKGSEDDKDKINMINNCLKDSTRVNFSVLFWMMFGEVRCGWCNNYSVHARLWQDKDKDCAQGISRQHNCLYWSVAASVCEDIKNTNIIFSGRYNTWTTQYK